MTITELTGKYNNANNKVQQISRVIENANEAFKKINKIESELDDQAQAAIEMSRSVVSTLCHELTTSKAMIQNYASLLDAIMRKTEIEWPPKCATDKP